MHTLAKQVGKSLGQMPADSPGLLNTALPVRTSRKIGPLANEIAGTQALPVDTNGKTKDHRDHSGSVPELEGTPVRVQSPPSLPPKFDKKTWQRNYMKIYMRKRRAKEREKSDK